MSIRVLVNGAAGKMGQMVVKSISSDPRFKLVGQTGRNDSLVNEIKANQAEVVVDFSDAESVFKNTQTIIETGAHPVIGATGLLKEQIAMLQDNCAQKKLGGVIAPNFSLGAVLMMKYAQEIVKYFPDVEIIEMHHDGKLDSPSGTALRSAELMAKTRAASAHPQISTREIVAGARGALYQQIAIHAIRLPGLVAHQQIIFGGTGETLTLRHDSIDRQCFMPGVLLACEKVLTLNHLIYGLEELF